MNTNSVSNLRQTALTDSLRKCQLFAGLHAEDVARIANISVFKLLEKGDYLFREGEKSVGFYVVQQGSINVHRVNAGGREQVIHVFRGRDSFAEATLVTDGGYPADARALESTRVILVQRNEFIALIRRQPDLSLRILATISQRLRVLVSQLEDLTLKDVETRLAHWLLKRCPDTDSEEATSIDLPMAKRVLAAELGTVSETFSRTLARFRQQNYIEVKGSKVTILSPARLKRFLEKRLGA